MTIRVVRKPFPAERIRRSIARILRDSPLCSMSTIGPKNRAHINTAYFCASPNLEVYFLSDPTSRHCKNLQRNPSMAMTIFRSAQEWARSDRGMQLFGSCHRVDGKRAREAERWYSKRFPTYGTWMRGTSKADRRRSRLLRSYAFYQFLPDRIKILDEAEFGGAAFVVAAVKRGRPSEGGGREAIVRWKATHMLVPSERGAMRTDR